MRHWVTRLRLQCLSGALLALSVSIPTLAQTWPDRPIKVLVPTPPGAGPDVVCRRVTQKLSEALGQSVTVENRPGASGHVAGEVASKSAADGYTLLCGVSSTFVTTPHVMTKLSYDPVKELAPISFIGKSHMVLVASPTVPADDLPSLISWIKANPGKVSFASPGVASSQHLAMEVFKSRAGLDMAHVPYNNSLAAPDLAAGRVQLMIDAYAPMLPYIQDKKVKLIAIASSSALAEFPNAALTNQTIADFGVTGWAALFAPKATAQAIIDRLSTEVTKILDMKDVKEQMAILGMIAQQGSPEATRNLIQTEFDYWGRVVKAANIRLE